MIFSDNDKAQLLLPISDEAFCGVYLKDDKTAFRPLRNAFNVAQTSLRKLSQNPEGSELEALIEENINNWEAIAGQLFEVFQTSSRDIELVGWFLAAQMLLDPSLKSFTTTLDWFLELTESNWDALQPLLPEAKLKSDTEAGQLSERLEAKRKAFFQWLGDSEESSLFYTPLLNIAIVGEVTFFKYQSAEKKGEIAPLKQEVMAGITAEKAEIQEKLDNCAKALECIDSLSKLITAKTQPNRVTPPNFGFIKSLLTKFSNAISHLTGLKATEKKADVVIDAQEDTINADAVNNSAAQQQSSSMQAGQSAQLTSSNNLTETANLNSLNRDLAFKHLQELTQYFRLSEPHSPISFLLEKAIRWGYMPLPELLKEMMSEADDRSLTNTYLLSGIEHNGPLLVSETSAQVHQKAAKESVKASPKPKPQPQPEKADEDKGKAETEAPSSNSSLAGSY